MLLRKPIAARGPTGAAVARLVDAHTALRRDAVGVPTERDHERAVRIGGVDREREPEIGRQPLADVDPALPGVVGAVDTTVELHEEALGLLRRAAQAVHAQL